MLLIVPFRKVLSAETNNFTALKNAKLCLLSTIK